ncbi:MAG: substrate-binding domain-containing protein [Mycobacterium sp.]
MGRHSLPEPRESFGDAPDGDRQHRRRRLDTTRRGVSSGVIAALVALAVLIGGVIAWQFFSDAMSQRSQDAARQCVQGTATVAVVADPAIADSIAALAETYNADAKPVGDICVDMAVTPATSDAVIAGLSGTWPAELGERPALWIPASSMSSARLQAIAGKEIVSDARSLVTSPVVLAVRPQLAESLGQREWPALPELQTNPTALEALNLPGWGSLRLALPIGGASDAAYLVAEAVAATTAPAGAPPTAGLGAVSALLGGQPRLGENSADEAWNSLMASTDPATAPVHAVAMTEQQLFGRVSGLQSAKDAVAQWIPSGPTALADYPTVLLADPAMSEEQISAASEFARFMGTPEQLDTLAKAGFRVPGIDPPASDVVTFPALTPALPNGDEAMRAAVAAAVSPAPGAATTVVLSQSLAGDEGGQSRLANVADALSNRIRALPPNAVVGLWTFDGADSRPVVTTGALSEDLAGEPRSAVLSATLDGLTPGGGGEVSFTTLPRAYSEALANYRPGQPNSVLVITAGPHTDRTLDGPGLQNYIAGAVDPNRPVAINVIDFGADPDRDIWEAVSQLSGGSYQEVATSESPDLVAAIARMLS